MSLLKSRRRGIRKLDIKLGADQPLTAQSVFEGHDIQEQGFHFGWFTSLILAGVAGSCLMLGALYTANDHKLIFVNDEAEQFDSNRSLASGQADRSVSGARKSNKLAILPLLTQVKSEKETIEITTTEQIEGRQVIRVKPYTRIETDLARSRTPLTKDLKSYNPISLMTAAAELQKGIKDRPEAASIDNDGAEITLSVSDFVTSLSFSDEKGLSDDAVFEFIQPFLKLPVATPGNFTSDSSAQSSLLSTASASFSPNNVAALEDVQTAVFKKTPFSALIDNITQERELLVQQDDELALLLSDASIADNDLTSILDAISLRFDANDLSVGQKIYIGYGMIDDTGNAITPLRISIVNENRSLVTIGRTASGRFVPLVTNDDLATNDNDGSSISLYHSIYETALRAKVPESVIKQIIHIFSFDMDYRRAIRSGDKIRMVFDRAEDELNEAQLLYASLELDGKEKTFYRFKTTDDGYIDYYAPDGRSAKKFLLRKPMHTGKFRSGFGMRRHPISRRYRMHSGVDWSARSGTPIVAAGDGHIDKASWAGGYGRQVKIRHKHGYVSSYSHLRRYGRGISPGAYVRQGQIIGYVGTSGLSTGPHLHYELIVNGRKVDPMRIRLPRGRTLKGNQLQAFSAQKLRVQQVLEQPADGNPLSIARAEASAPVITDFEGIISGVIPLKRPQGADTGS